MFRTKNKILSIICLVVLAILILRIYNVNANAYPLEEKIYRVNEWVPIDGNYFYNTSEGTNGYSLKVDKTELLTYSEYMKRFDMDEDYLSPSSRMDVILIEATLKNDSDEKGGLFIDCIRLKNRYQSYAFEWNSDYMSIANSWYVPNVFGASIQPHTEFKIYLPFTLRYGEGADSYLDIADLNEKYYLLLSNYPICTQIMIE